MVAANNELMMKKKKRAREQKTREREFIYTKNSVQIMVEHQSEINQKKKTKNEKRNREI